VSSPQLADRDGRVRGPPERVRGRADWHQQELKTINLGSWRERLLQNVEFPGFRWCQLFSAGLAAEGHRPDEATDAVARFLKTRQSADGRCTSSRTLPLESSDIEVTAASMRALQACATRPRG
jgi:hypothetical protein